MPTSKTHSARLYSRSCDRWLARSVRVISYYFLVPGVDPAAPDDQLSAQLTPMHSSSERKHARLSQSTIANMSVPDASVQKGPRPSCDRFVPL